MSKSITDATTRKAETIHPMAWNIPPTIHNTLFPTMDITPQKTMPTALLVVMPANTSHPKTRESMNIWQTQPCPQALTTMMQHIIVRRISKESRKRTTAAPMKRAVKIDPSGWTRRGTVGNSMVRKKRMMTVVGALMGALADVVMGVVMGMRKRAMMGREAALAS